MNDNTKFIIGLVATGVLAILTMLVTIFQPELHTILTQSPTDFSWIIVFVKYILLTGFIWSLLRIYTLKKLSKIESHFTAIEERTKNDREALEMLWFIVRHRGKYLYNLQANSKALLPSIEMNLDDFYDEEKKRLIEYCTKEWKHRQNTVIEEQINKLYTVKS